jgi:hypothetical protein
MCEVICYELFLVTNHSNENIRSRASKLVFFLMQVWKYLKKCGEKRDWTGTNTYI